MPGGNQGGRTGRIRPDERDTNDNAAILGANVIGTEAHMASLKETKKCAYNVKTLRDYRNRIKKLIDFWRTNYEGYYDVGVRKLTEEELGDEEKYYWKNTEDIIYEGLNVKVFLLFLASLKVKSTGKIISYVSLRKYIDALKWGANQAEQLLPTEFYAACDRYMLSYKKETAKAKSEGNMDEEEADPIPVSLFKLVLMWAISAGNLRYCFFVSIFLMITNTIYSFNYFLF